VRAYFDEWLAFYQDFYQFPPDLPVAFDYGFDSYKVTYCTVDTLLPGQAAARPTTATGMVSVPRKPEPLPTVVYLHGTSVSFYDAVSNPNIFGEFEERGESFDGPPSSSVFAGAGFIYIAPDYLGLGDSTVPRHRYFHAATEASAAVDLLAYDDVYDIYEQTSDVFRRPYASTVSDLFDMQHFFDDVLFALPPNSRALLTSPYYAAVIEDPQNPLRVRLRQNAVDRWGPSAPLLVYHSPDDEEVPYEDALVSADRLRGSGAVVTVEPIPGSDHVNSWVRAMPRAVTWFRSLE